MEVIFWNIHNSKSAVDLIAKTDFSAHTTFFAIAEYWKIFDAVENQFKGHNNWIDYVYKRTGYISSSFPVTVISGYEYYSHFRVGSGTEPIDIFVVHFKSQKDSESDSESLNSHYAREIQETVQRNKLKDVIVIGDFNLTHYNKVMLDHFHFNATSYFLNPAKKTKNVKGSDTPIFYSPIAALSGDLSKGPPGTYYHRRQTQAQAWHSFDNALISYNLSISLDKVDCEILTNLNGVDLKANNGQPDVKYSDHFPIKIKLK